MSSEQFQAAVYYCVRLGFKEIGYKGLETGNRQIAAHVVQQNEVRVLSSVDICSSDVCVWHKW